MTFKHPTEQYVEAYMRYSGALEIDLKYKRLDTHVLLLHKGVTYQISHRDDFKDNYRHYFSGSYDEIYTETPEPLWEAMINHEIAMSEKDMIIEIHRQWYIFWEKQRDEIKGGKERYEEFRRRSWEDLQILIEAIKLDRNDIVRSAERIEGLIFIPLVAMMIMDQFDDYEDFLDTSIELLLTEFSEFVTYGETFKEITIKTKEGGTEEFFIYNPQFEFEESSAE